MSTKTRSPLGYPPVASQPLQKLGDAGILSGCGAYRRRTRRDAALSKEPHEPPDPAQIARRYKPPASATGALASMVSELVENAIVDITCRDTGSTKPIREMASGVGKAGYRKTRMAEAGEMVGEPLDKHRQLACIHARPARRRIWVSIPHDGPLVAVRTGQKRSQNYLGYENIQPRPTLLMNQERIRQHRPRLHIIRRAA